MTHAIEVKDYALLEHIIRRETRSLAMLPRQQRWERMRDVMYRGRRERQKARGAGPSCHCPAYLLGSSLLDSQLEENST